MSNSDVHDDDMIPARLRKQAAVDAIRITVYEPREPKCASPFERGKS